MPTQRLVIDGHDQGHFFLSLQDGALTIGADPANTDLVLRDLRVVRIHCEVEVDDRPLVLAGDAAGQELHPGATRQFGASRLSLVAAADAPSANDANHLEVEDLVAAEVDEPGAPTTQREAGSAVSGVCKRLVVIDGADKGTRYALPESGGVNIGNSAKHAAIVLHDLYVARVHCDVQVEGARVVVVHREGKNGTLVNGQRIAQQELKIGDVLRVGNSHLRLELDVVEAGAAATVTGLPTSLSTAHAPRVFAGPGNGAAAGPGAPPAAAEQQLAFGAPSDPLLKLENNVLGNYQFGALLGRGHTGLVFRAHHRQNNQPVTVKVLAPEFPKTDAEQTCFARALKAIAPLRHPHLVPVFAAGKTGPYCWIAREYVEGESLATLIARLRADGKLGWKRACRVAVHLGKVLDFLHQNGMTHGNLTPANILIRTDTRTTLLADLMLDRALVGSELADLIREKKLLSELPYYAPEQTDVDAPLDHRTDLYALGTLLYALLTGQPPFTDAEPEAIIAQILEGKLVKPSKFLRETPPPFEAAVVKLLARRPEDRYQTAAELLAVVEPIANFNEIKV
jgi:hypothetical protein